jgi:hypothetical protein
MIRSDFGPLLIVISRDEVLRKDISGPITTLKHLIASRENIRANMLNVDISFSGYENTREELFEIPEVRNYVYALDGEFPFWLYFLSRHFMGLQCLAYCHLLPYLTEEARCETHPKQLADLIERRWGPALDKICSAAGHSESEADGLLGSALEYFKSGPSPLIGDSGEASDNKFSDIQSIDDEISSRYALTYSQEYVRRLLETACRRALARTDQDPASLVLGGLFLRAVQQLPNSLDQFPISLSWSRQDEASYGCQTITIGWEEIVLDVTESFDSGSGWDSESENQWRVDEEQQSGLDEAELEDWLGVFANMVEDADLKVSFSTDCDHPIEGIYDDPEPMPWFRSFP